MPKSGKRRFRILLPLQSVSFSIKIHLREQPEGDITKVDENTIPDHDVLVAGFPCQPFSIAGVSKKKSLGKATGFEDKTQGTLFFDVCRILKAKRPKAFIILSNSTKMINDGKHVRRDDEGWFRQDHSECGARSIEEFVDSY